MEIEVDINESSLFEKYPKVLQALLRCHSRFDAFRQQHPKMDEVELKQYEDNCNIIWATSDYASLGDGYGFHDQITVNKIIGEHGNVIRPRSLKTSEEQSRRIKEKAEVFTPSWVCNAQNNLVDEAWFGKKDVFNREFVDENGNHCWEPTEGNIEFPDKKKNWKDYVRDVRMEMCCGEGPYLMSRYDTVTGLPIPLKRRIGLLDRKLRVVGENTFSEKDWIKWAKHAIESTYGFEWQGDNLLLAREAMLYTIQDYYEEKFGSLISDSKILKSFAYRISWNLWQMDGLKFVVPESCSEIPDPQGSLFEEQEPNMMPCQGCKTGNYADHNGIKCRVRDWTVSGKDPDLQRPYFYQLLMKK